MRELALAEAKIVAGGNEVDGVTVTATRPSDDYYYFMSMWEQNQTFASSTDGYATLDGGGGGGEWWDLNAISLDLANWLDSLAEKILTPEEDVDKDGDRDLTDLAAVLEQKGDDLWIRANGNTESKAAMDILLGMAAYFGSGQINTLANLVDATQGDRNGR